MRVVLYQPKIPPNTGSVVRLCAATGAPLDLIEPLGFSIDDKHLKRAGLDYWKHASVRTWPDWEAFVAGRAPGARLVMTTARQGAPHHRFAYAPDDILVFGPEDMGLPARLTENHPHVVRIPIPGKVRSLNLSNAVGIVLYEAMRQTGALDHCIDQTINRAHGPDNC